MTAQRLLLCLLPVFLLGACGDIRPLHAPAGTAGQGRKDLNFHLATITIAEPGSRRDQILRNELIDRLDPAGLNLPPQYRLNFGLRRKLTNLAVQLDDSVTRRDLTLTATARLTRLDDASVAYRTAVTRVASFNILGDPFATLVAEQDAERRASIEIAQQLRTLIALYFEREATSH